MKRGVQEALVVSVLVLWLAGLLLRVGQWANILLLVAAALLVYLVIEERRTRSE